MNNLYINNDGKIVERIINCVKCMNNVDCVFIVVYGNDVVIVVKLCNIVINEMVMVNEIC